MSCSLEVEKYQRPSGALLHRIEAEQTFPREAMDASGLIQQGDFTDITTWALASQEGAVEFSVIPVLGFSPEFEPETIFYPANIALGKKIILIDNTKQG